MKKVIIFILVSICLVLFMPDFTTTGDSLYDKIKQKLHNKELLNAALQNEQKAQKELSEPIEGYNFVKLYHLVLADTKKDNAYYYGKQAAIFKGKNNYLLCYKEDGKIKRLQFKNLSNGDGIIVEDGKIIRFAGVYPDYPEGCEFDFCRNGYYCDFYFTRKL